MHKVSTGIMSKLQRFVHVVVISENYSAVNYIKHAKSVKKSKMDYRAFGDPKDGCDSSEPGGGTYESGRGFGLPLLDGL